MSHTPIPWTVRETMHDIEIRNEDEFITIASIPLKTLTDEESLASGRADARLIAAAPELLSELQDLVAFVQARIVVLGGDERLAQDAAEAIRGPQAIIATALATLAQEQTQ